MDDIEEKQDGGEFCGFRLFTISNQHKPHRGEILVATLRNPQNTQAPSGRNTAWAYISPRWGLMDGLFLFSTNISSRWDLC